jgi:hypothetical protein
MIMKSFIFTIKLRGFGDTPEQAWHDAFENFMLDPGPAPEEWYMEDDDMIETGEEVYCG